MRLGGPVFGNFPEPEAWVHAHRQAGYRAAYAPPLQDPQADQAFVRAAQKADLVIAEVGAWCNPISPDPDQARRAIDQCIAALERAERLRARCCVNIAGSKSPQRFDAPHPDNFSSETFDQIVQTVRQIIDTVQPRHTYYTLEPMPWIVPDSVDSYLELIRAIDRPAFAVHVDMANLMISPRIAFHNAELTREFFAKLGPYIRSVHAKDIRLESRLTVHIEECCPGTGIFDFRTLLTELARLDPDTPIMLEHMSRPEDYAAGAAYLRQIATSLGVNL